MTDFVVGDRVEYANENGYNRGPRTGDIGTVILITDMSSSVTVQFDNTFPGGHSAGRRGKEGHCWHCVNTHLRLINENEFDELSDAEISALI